MSDHLYHLICSDPLFMPTEAARASVQRRLKSACTYIDNQSEKVGDAPIYFHSPGNGSLDWSGELVCPACGQRNKGRTFFGYSIAIRSEGEWDLHNLPFRWLGADEGKVEMRCCGAHVPLAKVAFEPNVILARYAVVLTNPDNEDESWWAETDESENELLPERRAELGHILGCGLIELNLYD
jgi:hypothetical protein